MDSKKTKSVGILMATYNPNMDWLEAQLKSLNAQDYPSLSLLVLDDASPDVPIKDIEAAVKKTIKNFAYQIKQNPKNLGSCKTFERLVELGEGEYFATCDQDDIWESEKISRLMDVIEPDTTLIYSDLSIINGKGEKTHESLRDIRKRLKHLSGAGLAPQILFRNFVTGCTMMVRADVAKASVPFTKEMIGDHHITLYAASKGKIQYLDEPLVRYRQHETNVTGILKGVTDKQSYIDIRITPLISQFETLKTVTFADDRKMIQTINRGLKWLSARQRYLNGNPLAGFTLLWFSGLNFKTTLFDLAMPLMPKSVFQKALKTIRGESA